LKLLHLAGISIHPARIEGKIAGGGSALGKGNGNLVSIDIGVGKNFADESGGSDSGWMRLI
jgi:hypothetical protein